LLALMLLLLLLLRNVVAGWGLLLSLVAALLSLVALLSLGALLSLMALMSFAYLLLSFTHVAAVLTAIDILLCNLDLFRQ
jgi:hypothetical protein